jgi:hypothetical protein
MVYLLRRSILVSGYAGLLLIVMKIVFRICLYYIIINVRSVHIVSEGLDKLTREDFNVSQLKFLEKTQSMSQFKSNMHLF